MTYFALFNYLSNAALEGAALPKGSDTTGKYAEGETARKNT